MDLWSCDYPDFSECIRRCDGYADCAFVRSEQNPPTSGIFCSTRFVDRTSRFTESVLTARDARRHSFTISTNSPHVSIYPCAIDATYLLLLTRDVDIEARSSCIVESDVHVDLSTGLRAHIVDHLPPTGSVVVVWGDVPRPPGFLCTTLLNRSVRPVHLCAHTVYAKLIIE